MIRVRSYVSQDASALLDVFRSAVRDGARGAYTPEQLRAWAPDDIELDDWRQRLSGKQTWVAESDGRVVGFADLTPDGLVDLLFVAADYHRRGVATALMAEIEKAALTKGLAGLHVEASIAARPFFEQAGFAMVSEQAVEVRGQRLTNYRMSRRL